MDTWPFAQPRNTAVITLRRIVLPSPNVPPAPVLYVSHDADDGGWQFLDGNTVTMADCAIVGLGEMIKRDATLAQLADLPEGWVATRDSTDHPWHRKPQPDQEN